MSSWPGKSCGKRRSRPICGCSTRTSTSFGGGAVGFRQADKVIRSTDMGRRNEHTREELREIALQAAEQLVAAHGLAGLSTRKVVARIGYTVGSLYLVFRNLDDLIAQMNERTLDILQERLQVAAAGQPPAAALRALAQAYIAFALAQTHRWLALYQHRMPEGQSVPPSFAAKVEQMFDLVQRELALLGPRRPPADNALAARALWSGVHGICI
ncbi:TetR/AcrR family transcriptional regulator, partial [Arthrospira platensis SPKY1]|nr:TetR/AcrR family transcriptional regulator [Arthrospira platensis SPKY1]